MHKIKSFVEFGKLTFKQHKTPQNKTKQDILSYLYHNFIF